MAQVLTGAKGLFKIGESVVAFVSGVNVNQEDTLTDVDVLGQLDAADLAETGHRISFSINLFKSIDGTGQTADKGTGPNSAVKIGIDSADLKAKRNRAYFDCSIVDDNGNEIYKMEKCKMEGGSGQMDARGVWSGTWNFRALKGYGI